MFFLLEIANPNAVETFLASLPESMGLLIFGIVLVAIAVTIRKFIARSEPSKHEKESIKEI